MAKKSFDKQNCTYWWEMEMNPAHPDYKQSRLLGYSKFEGEAEAIDKYNWLMSRIEMLYKNDYVTKRCLSIKIWKRYGRLPNKSEDKHILTLHPSDYLIPNSVNDRFPEQIRQYLINFYDCILQKKDVTYLHPKPHQKRFENTDDAIFDVTYFNFPNMAALHKYTDSLLRRGFAPGIIENFIQKYSLLKNLTT